MGDALHVEFPELTPEAEALLKDSEDLPATDTHWRRRYLAAGVRAASGRTLGYNQALANSLHNPPLPPTLEELNQALQELEDWDDGVHLSLTRDWLSERISTLKRGIAHHLQG